jgi:hypothetical protein
MCVIGCIRGGYENLSDSEFGWELYHRGDSIFYGEYSGALCRVTGYPGFGGPYVGGDLNYINQGLMFAAGQRSISQLDATVRAWNTFGGGTYSHMAERIFLSNFGYYYWQINHGH